MHLDFMSVRMALGLRSYLRLQCAALLFFRTTRCSFFTLLVQSFINHPVLMICNTLYVYSKCFITWEY